MTFAELLNGLPIAILKAMVGSLLGGGSYLFWRWLDRLALGLTELVGGTIGAIVVIGLFNDAMDGMLPDFISLLVLSIPYGLGNWFHLLLVRGTAEQERFGYFSSASFIATSTVTSLVFGLPFFLILPYSGFGWPDWVYGICLFTSPSLSPLLILGWRNMKLRAGYDTPFEDNL